MKILSFHIMFLVILFIFNFFFPQNDGKQEDSERMRFDTYRIIVHILKVYLNFCKADKTLAAFILCKHIKSPLWTSVRWITIQRLISNNICQKYVFFDLKLSVGVFLF